ncbi:MAG: hypothetical protein V6Z86_05000 [Hyphomicrobiales bacterium]
MTGTATTAGCGGVHFPELLRTEQVNRHGARRGANALHIMNKAVFIRTTRRAGCTVVIAKADTTEVLRPAWLSAIRTEDVLEKRSSTTPIVGITPEAQAPGSAPGSLVRPWLHYGCHGQERRAEARSRPESISFARE